MKRSLLKNLLQAKQAGIPVALVTDLKTGQQSLVFRMGDQPAMADGDLGFEAPLLEEIAGLIEANKVALLNAADTEFFVQPHVAG